MSVSREDVVNSAREYLGTPYLYGGLSKKGIDCSGLIYNAYTANNIKIPRTSSLMATFGTKVTAEDILPGDIVHTPGHVRMVSKVEDGKIYVIESPSKGKHVYEHELSMNKNYNFRRIIT